MDNDGSGALNLKDIIGIYDVSMNPDFIEGRKTKEQILTEFLNNFEGAKGNKDGLIQKAEFFDYYTDLSMSCPSDEYFVRMMESTWQVPESDDETGAKATVQMLLTEVRNRVLQLARSDPKLFKKVFSDFDLN